MWRPASAGVGCAATAVAAALAIAACGSSLRQTSTAVAPGAGAPAGVKLTVIPSVGTPSSVLRFVARVPAVSGRHGQTDIAYTLGVSGGRGAGCVGTHSMNLVASRPGVPVTVSIGPAQLGGRWCPGTWRARVEELARPNCSPGEMCPQFIRLVAVIGPVTFRISG